MGRLSESLAELLHVNAATAAGITIAIVILAAALALWGIWWLWWRFPKRQMRSVTASDPKERADIEDNFRKTIGQALGGAAVLIGAGFALFQFLQQQKDAQDLRISNQVAKGFEQLSGKEIAMRLGGIYGLEGVMNTSSDYHQPVLEALCAFVRSSTIGMIVSDQGPSIDVQAALTVVTRRKPGLGGVNLFRANIPGANLGGTLLSRTNLIGANLIGANLSNGYLSLAYLNGAYLNIANLSNADLSGATLSNAELIRANVLGADLSGADLSDAHLFGVNLSGAQGLTQDQLNTACGKPKTLTMGLSLDKPCPQPP